MRNILKNKTAQSHFFTILIILLIASLVIVAAENATQTQTNSDAQTQTTSQDSAQTSQQTDTQTQPSDSQENTNLCENVVCTDSTQTCPDGFKALCSNSCDSGSGECSVCTPNCEGHEEVQPSETSNVSQDANNTDTASPSASNSTETSQTSNITNATENQTSITSNETNINETSENSTNQTQTNKNNPESSDISLNSGGNSESPSLDINISYNNITTRGGETILNANIANKGNITAKQISAQWILPKGFEIVNGEELHDCGDITSSNTCKFGITVKTSYSTSLGINQIKLSVSYNV